MEFAVATVLTVYGIETYRTHQQYDNRTFVATVLTVYGIETIIIPPLPQEARLVSCNSTYRLRY